MSQPVETDPSPGRWSHGSLPANASAGTNTLITSDYAFKRFRSREPRAVRRSNRASARLARPG